MTAFDKIIPWYVRFGWGFTYISVFMGLISFGMQGITLITVKGFYIPSWTIPVIVICVLTLCTTLGYYSEKYDFQNRIVSHMNNASNPEFTKQCKKVDDQGIKIDAIIEHFKIEVKR